jgi:hypothetical protein
MFVKKRKVGMKFPFAFSGEYARTATVLEITDTVCDTQAVVRNAGSNATSRVKSVSPGSVPRLFLFWDPMARNPD